MKTGTTPQNKSKSGKSRFQVGGEGRYELFSLLRIWPPCHNSAFSNTMGPVGVLRAGLGQVNSSLLCSHSFPPGATSLIILQGFNALKERLNRYQVINIMLVTRVSQKTLFLNFVSAVEPLVRTSSQSPRKKFQRYRPINDRQRTIWNFGLV